MNIHKTGTFNTCDQLALKRWVFFFLFSLSSVPSVCVNGNLIAKKMADKIHHVYHLLFQREVEQASQSAMLAS